MLQEVDDYLQEALRRDYLAMCEQLGYRFSEEKFDAYLDIVFEQMLFAFKEVNK